MRTPPTYMPNLGYALRRAVRNGATIGAVRRANGTVKDAIRVVAVAGKIVRATDKDTHSRWRNRMAAVTAQRASQRAAVGKRAIKRLDLELELTKKRQKDLENFAIAACTERDSYGHTVIRLDQLRAWVEEHMPSVLAVATEGQYLHVRFCATALRGAGNRAGSPNRYLIPAMWVTIDVDTGTVLRARSDGQHTGAVHPHARRENGSICPGRAVRHVREREGPPSIDVVKMILAEVEVWRQHYGDDQYERPLSVARAAWEAVSLSDTAVLAPIQGTTGAVYEDVNALLRAEPWEDGNGTAWCCAHDMAYTNCGCCPACRSEAGTCHCEACLLCGRQEADCDCCVYCEAVSSVWAYRGRDNGHQVCPACGYCRVHDRSDCGRGIRDWNRTLSFLTTTDAVRIRTLATLEYGRGMERPNSYSRDCNCGSCRPYTGWLERRETVTT